jgi:hypothetical protein
VRSEYLSREKVAEGSARLRSQGGVHGDVFDSQNGIGRQTDSVAHGIRKFSIRNMAYEIAERNSTFLYILGEGWQKV